MKVDFIYTDNFKKNIKPLFKKYRSLSEDLKMLENELSVNPYQGTKIGEDYDNSGYFIQFQTASQVETMLLQISK